MTVIETHGRTVLKTIVYRLLCLIATYSIAVALGGSASSAGFMALIILAIGIVLYYGHDRAWNRFNWDRDEHGKESLRRSIVKTMSYRLITFIISFILSKLILSDSNQTAATFAVLQFVVLLVLYYIVERVFNRLNIGRVIL
jgi:uncharacterized membrane protein